MAVKSEMSTLPFISTIPVQFSEKDAIVVYTYVRSSDLIDT